MCDKCGSTKTFVRRNHVSEQVFLSLLPDAVICGVRDCDGYAKPIGHMYVKEISESNSV